MDSLYSSINIYNVIKFKYKEYLKPEIISIVMIQSEDDVYLETVETETFYDGLEEHTTKRINLGFISSGPDEKYYFDPKESIEKNARKFINEFEPISIIHTTDLFHKEACEKIGKES